MRNLSTDRPMYDDALPYRMRTRDTRTTAETRIGNNITPLPNGCWQYGTDLHKYGTVGVGGNSTMRVHRFVYETLVGPIPKGHALHHTCENKGCVNPFHLEPLTPSEHGKVHAAMRKA